MMSARWFMALILTTGACSQSRSRDTPTTGPTVSIAAGQAVLANEHVSLAFSIDGALRVVSFVDNASGRDLGGGNSRVFVVAHLGDTEPRDTEDYEVAAVTAIEGDGEVGVRVDLEPVSDYPLSITLEIRVDASPDVRWDLVLRNNHAAPLTAQAVVPHLAGLDLGADAGHFFPMRSGMVSEASIEVIASYGGPAWMQWIDAYAADGGGLMLWSQDTTGKYKFLALSHRTAGPPGTFYAEYDAQGFPLTFYNKADAGAAPTLFDIDGFDSGIGMALGYLPIAIEALKSFAVPQAVTTVHGGDWRDAMAIYQTWISTWWQHDPIPDWFRREMLIWQGEPPTLEHPEVVWGASFWSQLHRSPADPETPVIDDFDTELWDENILWWSEKREVIDAQGNRMGAYIDAGEIMATTELAAAHGEEWVLRDLDGTPRYFNITKPGSSTDWWRLCPAALGWRDWLTEAATRIVDETGVVGIYLDTYGAVAAIPEYNAAHGHASPDAYIAGVAETFEAVSSAIKQINPEAVVYGEEPGTDFIAQFPDGSYDGGLTRPSPAREPEHNPLGIHFFRFAFPTVKLWVDMSAPGGDNATALRWHRLALYNGLGIWGPATSQAIEAYPLAILPALRAHADAFTSSDVEPAIPTTSAWVFANRFSTTDEDVYTFYNRDSIEATATLTVPERDGRDVTDLLTGVVLPMSATGDGNIEVSVTVGADDVEGIVYR